MMTASNMPPLRPFDGSAIPQALKQQRRWAPWRAVWNEKRKKYDKIPHRADQPKYGISTAKPEQWAGFDAALAAYLANPSLFAGIGYVMTGPHGVVGTDLDNCIVDGAIAPWAQEVIDQLASYTEISPSGNGLRILSTGELPADWNNHEIGIEIYGGNEARFLTVTGDHLPGTPTSVKAAPDGALKTLEARYAKERRKAEVIDLNMPEIIDDLLLPTIENLDIPYSARDFLETGTHRGDRSRELFSTAVALYSSGLPDDEVFSILAYNQHAMEIALDHRRQDHDRALLYLWREHCCKGKARATVRMTADDFDVIETVAEVIPTSPVKPQRFYVHSADGFMSRKPVTWLIKGVLQQAELCVIFGNSGSGKSFFALDMMVTIAQGGEWRGRKVKQGRSVYIASEGASGFRNRLEAIAQHRGIDLPDLGIGVITDAPNLIEKADIRDLIAAIKAFGQVEAIWVDTLAQSFQGNENSGEDMQRVLKHCKVLHEVTGAVVILIHHSGKDASKGTRGWSGLRGATNTQIEIFRNGDDRAAIIDKQKDGDGEGAEFAFKLNTVTIGEDEDGEAITSCVLEHREGTPRAQQKKEPKGDIEKLVLKTVVAFTELDADGPQANELVELVVNQIPEPNSGRDRRREVIMRALRTMLKSGHLAEHNMRVVLP